MLLKVYLIKIQGNIKGNAILFYVHGLIFEIPQFIKFLYFNCHFFTFELLLFISIF